VREREKFYMCPCAVIVTHIPVPLNSTNAVSIVRDLVMMSSLSHTALCLLTIQPQLLILSRQVSCMCVGWAAVTTFMATGCAPEATARPPIRYNHCQDRTGPLLHYGEYIAISATNRSELMPQLRMLIITP
jgi:hypothetical protein